MNGALCLDMTVSHVDKLVQTPYSCCHGLMRNKLMAKISMYIFA